MHKFFLIKVIFFHAVYQPERLLGVLVIYGKVSEFQERGLA